MVKKVLSLLTVFVVTSQIILTPVTASAETKITKPTNSITTNEISSVTPNVAIAPEPGGTLWNSWYVSKEYIPANKPNSFITGLITLAVTNKATKIGAPSYVAFTLSYLAASACVSMRTWDAHYITTYLFLYTDEYGRKYYVSDSYRSNLNGVRTNYCTSGRVYY